MVPAWPLVSDQRGRLRTLSGPSRTLALPGLCTEPLRGYGLLACVSWRLSGAAGGLCLRVSSGKTCSDSVATPECERKTNMAPEQEALYALQWNVPRSELSMAAQLEYDRLVPAWEQGEVRPAAGELEAARLAWEQDTARQAREQDTARQAEEPDGLWDVWERKRAAKLAARQTGLAWGHTVDRSGTI